MAAAKSLLPGAHEQLQLLQRLASSRSAAATAAVRASGAAQLALYNKEVAAIGAHRFSDKGCTECDGCGQPAVGLRRCARCAKAQYCRCKWVCSVCRPVLHLGLPAWGTACRMSLLDSILTHWVPMPCPPLLQPGVPGGALARPQARVQPRLRPRTPAASLRKDTVQAPTAVACQQACAQSVCVSVFAYACCDRRLPSQSDCTALPLAMPLSDNSA